MGDQSFSLRRSTCRSGDFMFANRHTYLKRTGQTYPKNTLHRLQPCTSHHCMNWEPAFGKRSPHSSFKTTSLEVWMKAMLRVVKGLKVQSSIPQQLTSSRIIEQQETITVACRGLYSSRWLTTLNCCQAPNANDDI